MAEMMLAKDNEEYHFRPDWLVRHGWKVVPVEDGNHFTNEDIAAIVSTLTNAGFNSCVAVATEPLGTIASAFKVALTTDALLEFNQECGLFRFLLTGIPTLWAISCNELYNLYAGPSPLVESMLGMPIDEARRRFLDFVKPLAKGDGAYPLLVAAEHYAQF